MPHLLGRGTEVVIPRCVMMTVVHDLAEAIVGDIAPADGIPKETKARLEAVCKVCHSPLSYPYLPFRSGCYAYYST